ncbi:MAG TPA: cysteine synthase A [Candidatus Faecimorpha stercoravium]|nr:cysteine synthase A [Candidatus Faecimorpha stercoravium]
MIYQGIDELVGKTPLVRIHHVTKGIGAEVLVKLERNNPAGSIKDRVALQMILDAEEKGKLRPGAVIIEPTSGNTGVGLAAFGAVRGYRVILIMPETMSRERQLLLTAYGAQVVLTPGSAGMQGAIDKARELAEEYPGSWIPEQFENPSNPKAHYLSTGPEIWEDTKGQVDILVAGVGTGGTLTGAGRYLKEQKPTVEIVAVEPDRSPLLSGGEAGPHGLQGIGANFIPKILDQELYQEVIRVRDEDAYHMGQRLAREEGILTGITSGAAVWAALEVAKRPENQGKTIVAILPDTGERYLSTPLFQEGVCDQ